MEGEGGIDLQDSFVYSGGQFSPHWNCLMSHLAGIVVSSHVLVHCNPHGSLGGRILDSETDINLPHKLIPLTPPPLWEINTCYGLCVITSEVMTPPPLSSIILSCKRKKPPTNLSAPKKRLIFSFKGIIQLRGIALAVATSL